MAETRRGLKRDERDEQHAEWLACARSFGYWCDRWAQVYDAGTAGWIPFHLWPAQREAADILQTQRLVVMLKARQLGMSWLVTAYGLWQMIFHPASTVLFFSKRDDEAVHLLDYRLRGMYDLLPPTMRAAKLVKDNKHVLRLSNGSAALAFPTTAGRSYTANLAVVDEADHCTAGRADALDTLLDAVKPTIDAGGHLVLLSTVDKRAPGSAFKRTYQAAKAGGAGSGANGVGPNGYAPVFLPWDARPDRTPEWYEAVRRDILARSGSLDSLYAEYPATDVEALAALTSDARFAAPWLSRADDTAADRAGAPAPALQNLVVYEAPGQHRTYIVGADPAEGNPQSDESAACVIDAVTGDQVAVWAGRFEPATFGAGLQTLAEWYAREGATTGIMVERNNHGHAVLMALRQGGAASVLTYRDGQAGWLTSAQGKALAVSAAADLLRNGCPKIRDTETLRQLCTFTGSRLAAPPGDHDDRCMAWIIAVAAAQQSGLGAGQYAILPPSWSIDPAETGGW